MELLSPSFGLILWVLLAVTGLVMTLSALVHLVRNRQLDTASKWLWTLWILVIPVLGAVCYFRIGRRGNSGAVR